MKINLTFEAEEFVDHDGLETVIAARDFRSAIHDALEQLRSKEKHGEEEWAAKAREFLWGIIREYDLERFF